MKLICQLLSILLWVDSIATLPRSSDAQPTFANVTLKSGDISTVVYLPKGLKPDEPTYYLASRFDHSSMIGNIKRTTFNYETGEKSIHLLYGTEQWRVPHDPYWPESGVGLAAEFGVGDDGAFCNYRCGWYEVDEVTNGVLGYQDAKNGESFLKIGVGELIKGSCPTCDSTEVYKFNSPYSFAQRPNWKLETRGSHFVSLSHEAVLNQYGYQFRKEITLNDDKLMVKTILTNIGRVPFATAWYSHHFYTCDNHPTGQGVGVDLDLAATDGNYEEPGTWFWATPIEEYADVTPREDYVAVEMKRGVEQNVRIKAEFTRNDQSHGSFSLHGCETNVRETIPEVSGDGDVSMYAFNLYIETGTFSPEPQIYMHLWPGQTTSWTQKLEFSTYNESGETFVMRNFARAQMLRDDGIALVQQLDRSFLLFALTAACIILYVQTMWKRRLRNNYDEVPDVESNNGGSVSEKIMDFGTEE